MKKLEIEKTKFTIVMSASKGDIIYILAEPEWPERFLIELCTLIIIF